MFGKLFLSKVNAEELPDIDKIYQRMQKPDLMVKKRKKLHTQKEIRQLFIVFLDFSGHQLKIRKSFIFQSHCFTGWYKDREVKYRARCFHEIYSAKPKPYLLIKSLHFEAYSLLGTPFNYPKYLGTQLMKNLE